MCDYPPVRASGSRPTGQHRGVLSTGALRAHLLAARLAGTVATSREESLRSYRLFAARDPRVLLGLDPEGDWGQRECCELMAAQVRGFGRSRAHFRPRRDRSRADVWRRLDAFADRIGEAAGPAARRCCSAPGIRTGCSGSTPPSRTLCRRRAVPSSPPRMVARVDIATRFGVRTYNLDYVRGVALVREPGVRGAPVVRPARTPILRSRFVPLWPPRRRPGGPCRSW